MQGCTGYDRANPSGLPKLSLTPFHPLFMLLSRITIKSFIDQRIHLNRTHKALQNLSLLWAITSVSPDQFSTIHLHIPS